MKVVTLGDITARTRREGDCLMWQGHIGNGSPQVLVDRRYRQVRRVVLELFGESIPAGHSPVMRCRNEACVERQHIALKTAKEIGRIAALEGKFQTAQRRAAIASGRQTASSILNWEKVEIVRAAKNSVEAAAAIGISKSMASKIRRGGAWRTDGYADSKPITKVLIPLVQVIKTPPGRFDPSPGFERTITADWMLRRQGVTP